MTIDDGTALSHLNATDLEHTTEDFSADGASLATPETLDSAEVGAVDRSQLLEQERALRPMLVLGDIVALIVGSALGHVLTGYVGESSVAQRAALMAVTAAGGLWAMRREGLWNADDTVVRAVEPRKLARSVTVLGLILLVADRFVRLDLQLWQAIASCAVVFALLLLWRSGFRNWLAVARSKGRFLRPTVVIGDAHDVGPLLDEMLNHPELGLDVRGFIGAAGDAGYADLCLGELDDAEAIIRASGATRVIVSPVSLNGDRLNRIAADLQADHIHVFITTGLNGVEPQRLRSIALTGEAALYLEPPRSTTIHHWTKRVFDIAAAALLLLVTAPLMLLVAMAVGLTSRGGVFFRHERVGQDGRLFRIYKFRTMVPGTHEKIWSDEGAAAAFKASGFKLAATDPAITKVGRFLRKTSLDELPQLFNVLKGDMSMVGVRPLVAVELEERSEFDQELYCSMKPGITGLWQVNGRSTVLHEDRYALDRQYMESWTLSLDLSILLRTPFAVLRHHHSA